MKKIIVAVFATLMLGSASFAADTVGPTPYPFMDGFTAVAIASGTVPVDVAGAAFTPSLPGPQAPIVLRPGKTVGVLPVTGLVSANFSNLGGIKPDWDK
jgi:hypothetical protein